MTKQLIILGMHRSGTSLTANWINKLGLFLGHDLIEPYFSNIKGHFEDREFLKINESILSFNELSKAGLKLKHLPEYISDKKTSELECLIKKRNSEKTQWGLKDPRTTILIDFYKGHLSKDVLYLIVFRDPSEVMESLLKRALKEIDIRQYRFYEKRKSLKILKPITLRLLRLMEMRSKKRYLSDWCYYNEKILSLVRDIDPNNYILIESKDLVKKDKVIFDKLVEHGLKLDFYPVERIFEKKLMHQTNETQIPEQCLRIWAELCRLRTKL